MKYKALLFFSFFFSCQASCMIELFQNNQNMLDMSQIIPLEVMGYVIGSLDYKTNIQLIRTCKTFYNSYAEKNDILFTHHSLNINDYTKPNQEIKID